MAKTQVKKDTLNKKISTLDSAINSEKQPQDSPDESGFLIESKDGNSNLRIYASIRVYGAYDFNGLQGGTSFSVTNIPTGSAKKNEASFFMTSNLTRFGVASNYKTGIGNLHMNIETDFSSDGNHLRLRQAFGRAGFLLAGQTWTVFSDNKSIPNTVDVDGPPTSVSLRSVQVRVFKETPDGWTFKGSIESPNIKIQVPDSISLDPVAQVIPDFATSVSKNFRFGHLQLAGVLRTISVRQLSGELDYIAGYGGLLSGRVYLIRNFSIMFQVLTGKGITSFLKVSQNNNIDVIMNPTTVSYELLSSYGGFVTLIKKFPLVNITTSVVYGTLKILARDYLPDNSFSFGNYLSINAFWFSKFGSRIGAEYNIGYSKNKKGEFGTANRFAFTFYYDL